MISVARREFFHPDEPPVFPKAGKWAEADWAGKRGQQKPAAPSQPGAQQVNRWLRVGCVRWARAAELAGSAGRFRACLEFTLQRGSRRPPP